jgi:capsule biosynthesis phosphatase
MNKRIVCDIDDTICFTTNRDWENATPIPAVIEKINFLYENGWEIILQTARGQVSCNGDSKKAEEKYGDIIRTWLKEHNVKYHILSFQKYLASYYIDDKSLRPDEFSKLKIELLKEGRSGARVERHGDRVYKTFIERDKALLEASWYNQAEGLVPIPKLFSVIDKTICIEYIENVELSYPSISFIKECLDTFSMTDSSDTEKFSSYIDRINRDHSNSLQSIFNKNKLEDLFQISKEDILILDKNLSFCHGDFSIENILITPARDYVLIDPIYKKNIYSSWLLDASKMLLSLRKYGRNTLYSNLFNFISLKSGLSRKTILFLEFCHWIRIYKYATLEEKDMITKNILEVFNAFKD